MRIKLCLMATTSIAVADLSGAPVSAQTTISAQTPENSNPDEPAQRKPPAASTTTSGIDSRTVGNQEAERGDIIVTGTRASFDAIGNQKIVNTPFTVVSVDQADIQKNAIATLDDMTKLLAAAKVGTPSTTAGSLISVRGDTADFNLVDGLPIYGRQIDVPLEPYQEVQVLAGLSSFYFGVSSGGGVVNYITKRPTASFKAVAQVGYDTDSVFSTALDVGDTVGKVGYRVNLASTNGTQSSRQTDIDRYIASLAVDFKPSDSTTLSIDGLYSNKKQRNVGGYISYFPDPPGPFLQPISGHQKLAGDNSRFTNVLKNLTATLRQDISEKVNLKLTASSSEAQYKFGSLSTSVDDYQGNVTNSVYFLADYIERRNVISGNLNAEFNTGSLIHAVSTGFLFSQTKTFYGATDDGTQFPYGVIAQDTNLYKDFDVPDVPQGIEMPSLKNKTLAIRERQISGFISDNISLGDHLKALVGLRYFDFNNRNVGADIDGGDVVVKARKPVPLAALLFKPTKNSTIYISFAKAFKNGGTFVNPDPNGDYVLTRFPFVKSTQYEGGYKIEGPRFKANIALYEVITYNNFYKSDNSLNLPQGAILSVVDGASTRRRGVEASGQLLLGSRVTVFAGGNFNDVRNDIPVAIGPRNLPSELLYKLRVTARLDQAERLEAFVGVDGNTASQALYDVNQRIGSYTVVDLGASYRLNFLGREARAQIVVNNVFGEKYWVTDFDSAFPGDPRTVKTQLSISF